MKKTKFMRIAIALVAVLCLSFFAACKGGGKQSSAPQAEYVKVSFDSFGGSSVATQTVEKGKCAAEPKAPTKSGFSFDCWVYGGEEYDFSTPVTKSITLSATWFDLSRVYRVTTGVDRTIDNRGTAVIKGEDASSKRYTEGTEVTLVATAFEGYAFAGWIDNQTDELVSTDAAYTFVLRGDVEVRASFICVVSGLEDAANLALYNALEGTQLTDGRLVITQRADFGGVVRSLRAEICFNRAQGLMSLVCTSSAEGAVQSANEFLNLWVCAVDGGYDCYSFNGQALVPVDVPDELIEYMNGFAGTDLSAEDREQAMLTVYNMLKGIVTVSDGGLEFSLNARDLLVDDAKAALEGLGGQPLKKVAHSALSAAWGEFIAKYGTYEIADTVIDLSTLSVKGWIEMVALINRVSASTMLSSFRQSYADAVNTIALVYEAEGLPMSDGYRQELLDYCEVLLAGTVSDMIEDLNTDVPTGYPADVPETASLPYAMLYASLNNFTVGEYYAVVMRALNLNGTAWDATAEVEGEPLFKGSITVEDGGISGFRLEINEKDGAATISVVYTAGCSLTLPPIE